MTQTMENALWHKNKSPLVNEYLHTAKEVEDQAAKQGFLYRPGFLGEMTTQIEAVLKYKLSDLNYQIVKEAIDRELAQTGHEYDIAAKEAMIAWELEKQTTLTSLQQEFADNKKVRELDKEQLDRLEIETNLRRWVILAAKVALDEEMEGYRQELVNVDTIPFDAETALLNAKLLTAQKKQDLIPYVEATLEKQQDIIDAEDGNADLKTALNEEKKDLNDKREDLITAREGIADAIVTLLAARESLVDKKSDLVDAKALTAAQEQTNISYLNAYISSLANLQDARMDLAAAKKAVIPKINDKSMALIAYTAELDAWIVVKEAIAGVKEQIAEQMEIRADRKGDIFDAKIDLNDAELDLKQARINLAIAKLTGRSTLLTTKINNAVELLEERQSALSSLVSRESELAGAQADLDQYLSDVSLDTIEEVNDISIPAQVLEIQRVAAAHIHELDEKADIASDTNITSELVHILS